MKKVGTLLTVISLVILLFTIGALAQGGKSWQGSGGWGPGSMYCRLFNPKAIETIKGEVANIRRVVPAEGMCEGVDIIVKSEKEEIGVNLGPAWFIDNQDLKVELKDMVEIKGSRVSFGKIPGIIATQVKKGEDVLMLRDEYGTPVWSWRKSLPSRYSNP
ncbi:MAG TPA: DNA-binding protein [Thermodesulfobacteriota bacterium]|nr:DNA-binding protein [Thermodesulfobacteriota bacterium]